MRVFTAKKDSRGPWEVTLTDAAGAADLTGNTAVKLWMRNEQTGAMKISGSTVTVVSATAGTVSYSPTAADVNTAGVYEAEFEVEYGAVIAERFPSDGYLYVSIVADLEP